MRRPRARARALGLSLLASLAALGVGALPTSRAAEPGPAAAIARATHEYLEHRATYEMTDDPAALASTAALLEQVASVPSWALEGRALVDRELLRARLERTVEEGLERVAGQASRVRPGPRPREGTASEERWARAIERLSGAVSDLLPDEVAAARSDLAAERTASPGARVRAALERLAGALDARAAELARSPGFTRPEREHLRTLRSVAGYAGTLEELEVTAELEARACGESMEAVAVEAGAPSALALIERLKEEGAREDPVQVAREEAARSAGFARDHGVVTIPPGALEDLAVEIGDARARTPFGHYIPVGWRGPQGHYVVTTPVGDDTGSRSRRRESHRLWLRGVAAHEGIPGHHLHFFVASRSQDELEKLPFEGATTEGWGLFMEGALSRAGYFAEPVEARLTPLRLRRWRALRVLLDLGLHTGRLSREQAIARMERDLGFDRTVCEDEVDRYRERPGYYSGYLLGAFAFERLERAGFARGGGEEARRVRDRILTLGPAAPLIAVERLAGDARVPVVVR